MYIYKYIYIYIYIYIYNIYIIYIYTNVLLYPNIPHEERAALSKRLDNQKEKYIQVISSVI